MTDLYFRMIIPAMISITIGKERDRRQAGQIDAGARTEVR